ncbi:MAG: exonuclease SbcCD subunit D [Eubacteriaceae bacterium]|nr:exonuclease SbcCD subunit D [Eubacteriaceae bacterium]
MRILHTADLHLGRKLHEHSLSEDQWHILSQILQIAKDESVFAVLIAGDVYDKAQPSTEAISMLDWFLTSLAEAGIYTFISSGNHDSQTRLAFGGKLLRASNIYISGPIDGNPLVCTCHDEFGPVNFYLMSHVKPALARAHFSEEISTHHEAAKRLVESWDINQEDRNVIIAHQFVTHSSNGPIRSESETIFIGGIDNVDASVFECFEYTALGHLHCQQSVYKSNICYSGSPLKYSFSEARHKKCVLVADIGQKGQPIETRAVALSPLRDVRQVRGKLGDIIAAGDGDSGRTDFIRATLTDNEPVHDALSQLRDIYPNLLSISFEASRKNSPGPDAQKQPGQMQADPASLFSSFFEMQNNRELSPQQKDLLVRAMEAMDMHREESLA